MAKRKKQTIGKDETHGMYGQFSMRMAQSEKTKLNEELEALYLKFNPGRDKDDPQGRRAVKKGDILKRAISIGLNEVQKLKKWNWDERRLILIMHVKFVVQNCKSMFCCKHSGDYL